MVQKVFLVGAGSVAAVIYDYLQDINDCEVVACVCDDDYVQETQALNALPIIPLSKLNDSLDKQHQCLIAVGATHYPLLRQRLYEQINNLGYDFYTLIHPSSYVARTATIKPGSIILDQVTIQPYVTIEHNVMLWSQTMVGHHSHIDAHCWLNSGTNICGHAHISKNCYFGVNAGVAEQIKIAAGNFIGAHVLITQDTSVNGVYVSQNCQKLDCDHEQFSQLRHALTD